jgi:hypothetical protein
MHRWLSAIVFAILLASTGSATAPTTVVNANDPTRHPYQQVGGDSCAAAGDCAIDFPAITAGETIIQHVSCTFQVPTGSSIAWIALGSVGYAQFNYLPVFSYGNYADTTTYGINTDTYLLYTKGQMPRMNVDTNTGAVTEYGCTLTGYYN